MALFAVLIILACLHVDSLRGGVDSGYIDCVSGNRVHLRPVYDGQEGTIETIYNVSPDDRLVLEPYLCPVGMKYLELVHSDGDSTATVRTIKPLDAEEIMLAGDALYYSVTCLGGAKNIRSVEVIDLNDNPPIFQSKTYGITVAEAISVGSDVLSVTATDNDLSLYNKELSYSILPPVPDTFELISEGPMNGCKIRLTKQLNYNNAPYYNFAVKASMEDSRFLAPDAETLCSYHKDKDYSDTAIVTIAVKDYDSHDPYFDHCLYKASIEENKVGHFSDITPEAIKAQDGDKGINTPVVYSITTVIPKKYQNNFKIDLNSGVISVTTALDREETEQISVFIQVAQNNHPYRTADAAVLVTIVDVNDIQLKFDQGVHSSHFA